MCVDGDGAIGRKTVGAAVECAMRIEFAHLRLQLRDFVGANIGRIGDDEVAGSPLEGGCLEFDILALEKLWVGDASSVERIVAVVMASRQV